MGERRRWRAALAAGLFLASIAAAGAAPARVAVVALALWGDQGVFRSEATGAARLLAQRFAAAKPEVRVNTPRSFAAGPAGLEAAIARAEAGLDPDRDVLVVMMTSHGTPNGIAVKGGRTDGLLAPGALGDMLSHGRLRRQVLLVSACYSGIFTTLASPNRLVITAADADHPSFGCEAGARWTYFGRAFFDEALRATGPRPALDKVYARAAVLVRAREMRDGYEPSNPQMAGGEAVLQALADRP